MIEGSLPQRRSPIRHRFFLSQLSLPSSGAVQERNISERSFRGIVRRFCEEPYVRGPPQVFLGSLRKERAALFLFLADFVALLGDFSRALLQRCAGEELRREVGIVLATGKVCLRHPAAILRAGDAEWRQNAIERNELGITRGDLGPLARFRISLLHD